jgi:hypothetical protein
MYGNQPPTRPSHDHLGRTRKPQHSAMIAIVAGALALLGCSDQSQELVSPSSHDLALSSGSEIAAEQQALAGITRTVALALSDEGLRQRIKNDLRASRFTVEHKLPFSEYLRGESGGILLAEMAQHTELSPGEIVALLDNVRPLEFYMPVPEHRNNWTGGSDLLVASLLSEDEAPIAYELKGNQIELLRDEPPVTPVLILTPVETDFTQHLDASFLNVKDMNGQAIGTWTPFSSSLSMESDCTGDTAIVECDDGSGGGGGGSVAYCGEPPSGTVQRRGSSVEEFVTCMRAINDHEPWGKGNPEFYLLLAGTLDGGSDWGKRINITEHIWDGSDDDLNRKWRKFDPISLLTWDTDMGTRIRVQCFEDDFNFNASIKVTGSTQIVGVTVSFSADFKIGDTDDNCGSNYIDLQNSSGAFYYIPDGKDDDTTNPAPPYYNGTSDLHWAGFGIQRL